MGASLFNLPQCHCEEEWRQKRHDDVAISF